MACCDRYCAAEAHFDRAMADSDLKRYRRQGPDVTTRLMLEELRRWPLKAQELLDVGSGIGILGAELATDGLSGATMVEASPAYLEVARVEAGGRYPDSQAQFIAGDFAAIAKTVPDADIVTLDRVVCCYPNGKSLLCEAAAKTRELLAFSYPRDRWYVRMVMALENLVRRLRGNTFRTFVHSPEEMAAALAEAGLSRVAHRTTIVWALDVYRRKGTGGPI